MTDKIAIIDLHKPCAKCGGNDIHHCYVKQGERLDMDWAAYQKSDRNLICSYCRTCRYRWNSLPMDERDEQPAIAWVSVERLVHLQCNLCKGWWSVGDAPEREYWHCPHCGVWLMALLAGLGVKPGE